MKIKEKIYIFVHLTQDLLWIRIELKGWNRTEDNPDPQTLLSYLLKYTGTGTFQRNCIFNIIIIKLLNSWMILITG
jgi:hypothetical protein